MPPVGGGQGRYEVRPHPTVKGLAQVVYLDGTPPATPLLNVGERALPLLLNALQLYLAAHPALAVPAQPEGDPG